MEDLIGTSYCAPEVDLEQMPNCWVVEYLREVIRVLNLPKLGLGLVQV